MFMHSSNLVVIFIHDLWCVANYVILVTVMLNLKLHKTDISEVGVNCTAFKKKLLCIHAYVTISGNGIIEQFLGEVKLEILPGLLFLCLYTLFLRGYNPCLLSLGN